eukprot:3694168-Pleurochrysis_carterae.AAC.2
MICSQPRNLSSQPVNLLRREHQAGLDADLAIPSAVGTARPANAEDLSDARHSGNVRISFARFKGFVIRNASQNPGPAFSSLNNIFAASCPIFSKTWQAHP